MKPFRQLLAKPAAIATLSAICAAPLAARPFIFYRGILNGASFAPQGMPNGAIARGSIFSIFGRDLGPADPAVVSAFPLGDSLAGVSIEVCGGDDCRRAIPLFVAAGQINAILPSDAPLGRIAVRVSFHGEAGNWSPITVVESSVGLFAVNSAGVGPGITQNFIAPTDQPINSRSAAARPGQVVTLWGTGLGPALNADRDAPQPGDLAADVEVFVGGAAVTNKLYAGRSPCCSGVDQIVFEVPAEAPLGCYVPIQIRTNGDVVSNSVSMAISADGSACAADFNPLVSSLAAGGRVGSFFAHTFDVRLDGAPEPVAQATVEGVLAFFRRPSASPFYYDVFSLPPVGTCVTSAYRGDFFRDRVPLFLQGAGLDAGPEVSVRLSGGADAVEAAAPGTYAARLSAPLLDQTGPLIALGDEIRISGSGTDVAGLSGSLTAVDGFDWRNREGLTSLQPGDSLTLQWTPGPSGSLAVVWGESYSVTHDASGRFACLADASSGAMTVPPWITAQLPQTAQRLWEVDAWVALGALPPPGSLVGSGLDAGASFFSAWRANTVTVLGAERE